MPDTLHPIVNIKVGDKVFNAPPQYLQEFHERSAQNGFARVTFKLIDPTYVDLEKAILDDTKNGGIVRYCWGYPGAMSEWRELAPMFMLPEITDRGYTLTVEGTSVPASVVTQVEPQSFSGKISSVVDQVAKKLDALMKEKGSKGITKTYIEETADDDNEEQLSETTMGPPYKKSWNTGNYSLTKFIREIQPQAVSKQSKKSDYCFFFDVDGGLHFHTRDWDEGRIYNKTTQDPDYRTFRFLWGIPGGVTAFRPTISSEIIGSSAKGWVASTVDPKTKQFIQIPFNKAVSPSEDGNLRTMASPPDKTNPDSVKRADVRRHEPSKPEQGPGTAINRTGNDWRYLNASISEATIDLVGLPEYTRFTPTEMFCYVHVTLPGGKLHWTSGKYLIQEVSHDIVNGRYSIHGDLFRGSALEGPAVSKAQVSQAFQNVAASLMKLRF